MVRRLNENDNIHVKKPEIVDIRINSWTDLVSTCKDHVKPHLMVDREVEDMISAGPLSVGERLEVSVQCSAFDDGLIVSRLPFSFFRGRPRIAWESIVAVTEFSSYVSKSLPDHTVAIIRRDFGSGVDVRIPWNRTFNEFLHERCIYLDRTKEVLDYSNLLTNKPASRSPP